MQPTKIIDNHLYGERRNFPNYKDMGHYYFDKLWTTKLLSRKDAYVWLSEEMEIPLNKTHFRMFNDKQCLMAVKICQELLNDLRRLDLDFGVTPLTPQYIIN
jgi:hypothetical protein